MRVRARARQRGVELPLVISDHADWDGLTATIAATGASEVWVTHGQEDALVHWSTTRGLQARPLDIVGYGDEDESDGMTGRRQLRRGTMNRFAELLDRLAYEPGRNNKLRLMTDYFRSTPDPERGWALAALTGALSFQHAKPGVIRALIAERTDPVLFELSYDYVGDLSETVALMWPADPAEAPERRPVADGGDRNAVDARQVGASRAARALARPARRDRPLGVAQARDRRVAHRRVGAAGEDRSRCARRQGPARDRDDLARLEAALCRIVRLAGRPRRQAGRSRSCAVPAGDARACDRGRRSGRARSERFHGANGNGTASASRRSRGRTKTATLVTRLYSRTGEDISGSFPDLVGALRLPGAIDGELLIVRDGRVQSFNVLQQRLNRKTVTPKLLVEFPAHLRAYDLLVDGEEDLRELAFADRRARLEDFVARLDQPRVDLSPLVAFTTWDELAAARSNPAAAGAGADADAVEGVMLKRRDAPYLPGRPKGPWWKWKRDPFIVDAVLMYAQRGHGKRSSYYSDYTFGVWTKGEDGDELVPVGKAYFGFTDEELHSDRPLRPPQHRRALRPGARGGACGRAGAGARGGLRRTAALDAAQVRPRHAFSPHKPAPLGQAAKRGRSAGNAQAALGEDRNRTQRERPRRVAQLDRMMP